MSSQSEKSVSADELVDDADDNDEVVDGELATASLTTSGVLTTSVSSV